MSKIEEKHIENLIKVNASLNKGTVNHYQQAGLQYVDVPQIVGITGACENIDTLFKIGNRLDLPLFFTQTGQLALEQSLTFSHGVYTIIHSGRDEEEEDERHLRQFLLTEEEFDCTLAGMTKDEYEEEKMFETLLSHIESTVKAMLRAVINDHKDMLSSFYGREVSGFSEVLDWPFLKVPYEKAVKVLQKEGYSKLQFGDDLKAEHEQEVVRQINFQNGRKSNLLPVFITRYPKEIKFFNMKVSSSDPKVVLSADLILPISGEATGSAVREHDGVKLRERLLISQMYKLHQKRGGSYKDFSWYVDELVRAGKTNPHAGYGVGNERVLQFILGQKDIRQCSIFYLLAQLSGDWDRGRRGYINLYSMHKKAVLLAIGRDENKKKLLPSIKEVYGDNITFYATEKTHKFLNRKGISSILVHKISEEGEPNIKTLMERGAFDIVVNIPTREKGKKSEETDGKRIRKMGVESGVTLITDVEVAEFLLKKLSDLSKESKTEVEQKSNFIKETFSYAPS